MVIVTITIKAAFEDIRVGLGVEDYLSDKLVEYLSDGMAAEVAFSVARRADHIEWPDYSEDMTDQEIESWQEKARTVMEAACPANIEEPIKNDDYAEPEAQR